MSETSLLNKPRDPRTFRPSNPDSYCAQWHEVMNDIRTKPVYDVVPSIKEEGYAIVLRYGPQTQEDLYAGTQIVGRQIPLTPTPAKDLFVALVEKITTEKDDDLTRRVEECVEHMVAPNPQNRFTAYRLTPHDLALTPFCVTLDRASLLLVTRPTKTFFETARHIELSLEKKHCSPVVEQGRFNITWGPYLLLGVITKPCRSLGFNDLNEYYPATLRNCKQLSLQPTDIELVQFERSPKMITTKTLYSHKLEPWEVHLKRRNEELNKLKAKTATSEDLSELMEDAED